MPEFECYKMVTFWTLRVVTIAGAVILALLDISFLGRFMGAGAWSSPEILLYGIPPLAALPVCLLSRRFGKWSVVALWGIFLLATSAAVWSVWSWCTPWWCGERSFWSIIKARVVMDPLVVLAFALAFLVHAQHALCLRLQPRRDRLEARS